MTKDDERIVEKAIFSRRNQILRYLVNQWKRTAKDLVTRLQKTCFKQEKGWERPCFENFCRAAESLWRPGDKTAK